MKTKLNYALIGFALLAVALVVWHLPRLEQDQEPTPQPVAAAGDQVKTTQFEVQEGQLLVLVLDPITTTIALPATHVKVVSALDPTTDELQLWRDGQHVMTIHSPE